MGLAAVFDGARSLLRGSGRPRYRRLPTTSMALGGGVYGDDDNDDGDEDDGWDGNEEGMPHRRRSRRLRVGDDDAVLNSVWARGNRRFLRLTLVAASLGLLLYLGVVFSRVARARTHGGRPPMACDTVEHGYRCYLQEVQHWGQYAPFFRVPPPPDHIRKDEALCGDLPRGCRYTFAQVLSRHAARDPTAARSAAYRTLVTRILASVRHFEDGPYGPFAFLNDYAYRLGADELTLFGEQQMVHSGAHFYRRYRSLVQAEAGSGGAGGGLGPGREPFVRAADQNRVVVSAINWLGGFEEARQADGGGGNSSSTPGRMHILLLPEAAGFNNTLSANGLCPAFSGSAGTAAQRTFAATFVPYITERLNRGMPGADLTDTETIALMDLCPFETVADELDGQPHKDGSSSGGGAARVGGRRLSPFCRLFSPNEWRDYDYYRTLGLWYGYGGGSALGATQGVGFVNELVARLTATPVADATTTNRTLDADPATFPLNATVYADFSHDNDMVNVFTALGLYGDPGAPAGGDGAAALPHPSNTTRTEPEDMRGFAGSWAVPFAARLYVEKMVCEAGGEGDGEGDGEGGEELVRILVNDRVVPLLNCGADKLGRCRLSRFVESLAFARGGGRWEECFA